MKKVILLMSLLAFTIQGFSAYYIMCNGSIASVWQDNPDGSNTVTLLTVLGPCSGKAWIPLGVQPNMGSVGTLEATPSQYAEINNFSGNSTGNLTSEEQEEIAEYLNNEIENNNLPSVRWWDPNKLSPSMKNAIFGNEVFGVYGLVFNYNTIEVRSDIQCSAAIKIMDFNGNVVSSLNTGLDVGTQNVQINQLISGLSGNYIITVNSGVNVISKTIML